MMYWIFIRSLETVLTYCFFFRYTIWLQQCNNATVGSQNCVTKFYKEFLKEKLCNNFYKEFLKKKIV